MTRAPPWLARIIPLCAVGTMLAGCSAGTVAPGDQSPASQGTLIPAPAPVGTASADCPQAAARWAAGERDEGFYQDLPERATIIETNSGTILETVDSTRSNDSTPSTTPSRRVTPDPTWPKDSVVVMDDSTDDVVDTIYAADNRFCTP